MILKRRVFLMLSAATTAIMALPQLAWAAPESFSTGAFSADAFSADAFDLGSDPPSVVSGTNKHKHLLRFPGVWR